MSGRMWLRPTGNLESTMMETVSSTISMVLRLSKQQLLVTRLMTTVMAHTALALSVLKVMMVKVSWV
ncbi:hypothetical protein D3C86_2155090 [compost metagenome]